MWTSFDYWLLTHRDPAHALHLLEVSGHFPRASYNSLFRRELERRAAQIGEPVVHQQVVQLQDFDWIGYMARSLRNAGFLDHDIDPLAHEIAVRLLVKPGTLFKGWDGHSPILARFKVAVRNSILNILEKRQTRRRRIPSMSIQQDSPTARDLPASKEPDQALINDFREFLKRRHGAIAVRVLDQRLSGDDTKHLIGQEGLESAYRVKQLVQAIKRTAEEFGGGDPEFLSMVRRAMSEERDTIGKRFATRPQ